MEARAAAWRLARDGASPMDLVRQVPLQQQAFAFRLARDTTPGTACVLLVWLPLALQRELWPEMLFVAREEESQRQILLLWMRLARGARLARRAPPRRAVSV